MKANLENATVLQSDWKKKILAPKNLIIIIAVIAVVILLALFVPVFWSTRNITSILVSTSTVGLLAVGISIVLAGQGLDISLPSVMALSAIVGAKVMVATQNVPIGIVAIFAVAIAFGTLNGIASAVFKMHPFIVTMSTMILAQGTTSVISKSVSVSGFPHQFVEIFNAKIGGFLPVPIIVLIVFTVVGYLVLNKSLFGRQVFAIGVNEKAAMVCGIKVTRVKFMTYFIASLYAAIVAIILTARLNSATPSMASDNMNLDVLAAAVLGGVSMQGGTGTIIGVFIGAFILTTLATTMNLLNVGTFQATIVKGVLVLVITYLDASRARRK